MNETIHGISNQNEEFGPCFAILSGEEKTFQNK